MGDRSEKIEASGSSGSRKAHHVAVSPQEDRNGAEETVGESKGGAEEGGVGFVRAEVKVDAFTQQRVLALRQEIASLQRDNDSYRLRKRHPAEDASLNEERRLRPLAIKEEFLRMTQPPTRGIQ